MILPIVLIVIGLVLLLKGADWMVFGSSRLAYKYGISPLVVGLTVVAFGTSAPELVVSLIASMDGRNELVLGNVIGSNSFNLFIILGIAGLISPLSVHDKTVSREIPLSLLAAAVLIPMMGFHSPYSISGVEAGILLLCFAGFMYYIYRSIKSKPSGDEDDVHVTIPGWKMALYMVGGLVGLIAGGQLVMSNAVGIAEQFGWSEKLIGMTILAAGTSLPELFTSIVAARKGQNDIAIGNVIGSNIFNVFGILGITALVKPIHTTADFSPDVYMIIAGTLFLLLAMFTGKRKKLDRWEAILLILAYLAYSVWAYQS